MNPSLLQNLIIRPQPRRASKLSSGLAWFVLAVATAGAHAQLQWDTTSHEIEPPPGQRWIEAEFAYTNAGAYPLTITKIATDRGRLTAQWRAASRTVQPGDSGVLGVKYRNSGIVDVINATVRVHTDERSAEPAELTLSLLPRGERKRRAEALRLDAARMAWKAPYSLEPRVLWWTIGGEALPQVVDLKAVGDAELPATLEWGHRRLSFDQPDNGQFVQEIEVVESGRHVRITLTPTSTEHPVLSRWGVSGWSPAAVETDPMLADAAIQLRHGLQLLVVRERRSDDGTAGTPRR